MPKAIIRTALAVIASLLVIGLLGSVAGIQSAHAGGYEPPADFDLPEEGLEPLTTEEKVGVNTAGIDENRDLVRDNEDAVETAGAAAAIASVAASHQFRVSPEAPLQGSIAVGTAGGHSAMSMSIGGSLNRSLFGTLQAGSAGADAHALAVSLTWGF